MPKITINKSFDEKVKQLFERKIQGDLQAREELINLHLNLAIFLTKFFGSRFEPKEDLIQVATIGLINAVDRFDPNRKVKFSTYASNVIMGVIKRYLRDKSWIIKPPRLPLELSWKINKAIDILTSQFHRPPKIEEIAEYLTVEPEKISRSMEIIAQCNIESLDSLIIDEKDGKPKDFQEYIGQLDPRLDGTNNHCLELIFEAVGQLDSRSKKVIYLRFFERKTQKEISKIFNCSQMLISRILKKAIEKIKQLTQG
jgi:RNA polymerase sigma-B factor